MRKEVRKSRDWEYLCRRCHMVKDGRLKKLIKRNKITDYTERERNRRKRLL
jgi:hypothetical protein